MPRVPYETRFLRDWIRRIAGSVARESHAPPQTTYENTFRWHFGPGDRPNLFLFRHPSTARDLETEGHLVPFDAVLIDGLYGYEWVRHELAERGASVRPGGVILVHRRGGGFDRALRSLEAWADDGAPSTRWPQQDGLEIVKVFEDLRAAVAKASPSSELRDLREDFEHEALRDGPARSDAAHL